MLFVKLLDMKVSVLCSYNKGLTDDLKCVKSYQH